MKVTVLTGTSNERFITETGLAARVAEVAEPVLADLGYRLVRVKVEGRPGTSRNLQIMAEQPDGTMTIDDCETVSRQLSAVLDVHDPLKEAYRLEVSSPGIDRPLVRPTDFEDWAGHEAKIELSEPIDGRRRFRGRVAGFENDEVLIEVDLDQVGLTTLGLPIGLISDARLVLTDDLVRESLQRAKKSQKEINAGQWSDGAEAPDDLADLEDED